MSKIEFHEKRLADLRSTLTQQEELFLTQLYEVRMMTKDYLEKNYHEELRTRLLEKGLIKEETLEDWAENNHTVYYLEQDGVGIVYQILNLEKNVRNEKDSIAIRHRFKASELRPLKEEHRRRLFETTRFVEAIKQQLDKEPQIRYRYYDEKFNKLYVKQRENHYAQDFPSDGVLLIDDYEIHIHEVQERLTKIELFVKKHYLPFVQSEMFKYIERPMLFIFLVETKEEADLYREKVADLIGNYLTPYFNFLVTTQKQALQFMKHKFIPELRYPYYFKGLIEEKIKNPEVKVGLLKKDIMDRLYGHYHGVINYQGQLAFVVDYRYKDVLSHYTLQYHLNNQKRLKRNYRVLAWNNDKLSKEEDRHFKTDYIYCVSVEKLQERKWLNEMFRYPTVAI